MKRSTKFHQMPTIVIIVGGVAERNIAMRQRRRLESRLDLCQINRGFTIADFALVIILLVSLVLVMLNTYVMVLTQ